MGPPTCSNRSSAEHSSYFTLAEANWFPKERTGYGKRQRGSAIPLAVPAVALPAPLETHHLPTDSSGEANLIQWREAHALKNTAVDPSRPPAGLLRGRSDRPRKRSH